MLVQCKSQSRLVDDLIPIILELSGRQWWSCDLLRLALISPAWIGPVRRRLYACPVVHSFAACTLLGRTLEESPHIRALVRGLDLRPVESRSSSLTAQQAGRLRQLLNLKGLQSLTLGGELAASAERFLYMMTHSRTIVALYLDGSHLQRSVTLHGHSRPPSIEWNEVLAFKFSNLRDLRICNLALSIAPPNIPYSLRIESVILDGIVLVDGLLSDLCFESWQSVRKLHISVKQPPIEMDTQLRETLESCECLQSFSYEEHGTRRSLDIDHMYPPLSTLKRLSLTHVDATPLSLEAISTKFGHVEELSIAGRNVRITPEQWVAFVRSGSLPSLNMLTTSLGTNIPPFKPWTEEMRKTLLDACIGREIVLV
ncbi:hypothetical protein EIP91_000630 [Steccherinum ochraceum]|uniref:F-box domain-containing protein n=1 Tax=Steccherinum ochraceum TaxID=92696 RepID=A0A4R0RFD6_9APHY|nr:hypothetical protein EIP91_000630 [Steccherinum ochraceum]